MIPNYSPSLTLVLLDEGSTYTDNANDRGGPTRYGVTQGTLSDYLGRPATIADVQGLTSAAVAPIYKSKYWDAVRGDELWSGLDYFLFDSAVQHGANWAIRFLQEALRITTDGQLGPATMRACAPVAVNKIALVELCRQARWTFYEAVPSFPTFGRGWGNRLTRVALTASAWAKKESST